MKEFTGFPKIPRFFRDIVITEKIDGTNGQVVIDLIEHVSQDEYEQTEGVPLFYSYDKEDRRVAVRAASRNKYLELNHDNYGFARWVLENTSLAELGPGKHFGEFWGQGIQRNYGLKEKRFSLFNAKKWGESRPECCHVVPILYEGGFNTAAIQNALWALAFSGSIAAPGFMKPEGVVVYHTAGNILFKATLENDEKGKPE